MFLERILYFWDRVNAAVVSNMVIPTVKPNKLELKKVVILQQNCLFKMKQGS